MGGWKIFRLANSVSRSTNCIYTCAVMLCVHCSIFRVATVRKKSKRDKHFSWSGKKSVNFFLKSGEIFVIVNVSELYPLCTHNPLKSIKRLKMKWGMLMKNVGAKLLSMWIVWLVTSCKVFRCQWKVWEKSENFIISDEWQPWL